MIRVLAIVSLSLLVGCSLPMRISSGTDKQVSDINENKCVSDPTIDREAQSPIATTSKKAGQFIHSPVAIQAKREFQKVYLSLSKAERKELKKEVKKEIKTIQRTVKNNESVSSNKSFNSMDYDLKMATIFGVVGIVGIILGLFSSVLYVLGGISLVIGLVFFLLWLFKQ